MAAVELELEPKAGPAAVSADLILSTLPVRFAVRLVTQQSS